jgi:tetratricopeptide (TPR) repeat protein
MDDIKKLVAKGIKAYNASDFLGSIKSYERARSVASLINNQDLLDLINRNIALSQSGLMQYDKALSAYNMMRKTDPQSLYEKSLALFHVGQMDEALKLYQNRYLIGEKFPPLPLRFIHYIDGFDELSGKNVLILNEEGIGDELMYLRSIFKLSESVSSATVQVYPGLLDLIQSNISLPNITFFSDRELRKEFVSGFDVYSSTGTLWNWFPYEKPLELKSNRPKLEMKEGKNIAFVHSPNIKSKNHNQRKVPESYFKGLLKPGTNLHSMQFGTTEPYAINYPITNFVDTLNIIESVDEIHTVDTSVAHLLANSYARHEKPSTLVYKQYLDWRWHNHLYDIKVAKV